MYVHHIYTWYPRRLEEGIRAPGTGVTGGCESPHKCQEANPGSLQEHVLLTSELFSSAQNVDKDPRDMYPDKDLCTQRRFHLQYKAWPQKKIS